MRGQQAGDRMQIGPGHLGEEYVKRSIHPQESEKTICSISTYMASLLRIGILACGIHFVFGQLG